MTGAERVETILAEQRCRDVHGDTYTPPFCESCRGWAAHVAALVAAETGGLAERVAALADEHEAHNFGYDGRCTLCRPAFAYAAIRALLGGGEVPETLLLPDRNGALIEVPNECAECGGDGLNVQGRTCLACIGTGFVSLERIPLVPDQQTSEGSERTFTAAEVIEIANETSDPLGNLYRLDFIDRINHEAGGER